MNVDVSDDIEPEHLLELIETIENEGLEVAGFNHSAPGRTAPTEPHGR